MNTSTCNNTDNNNDNYIISTCNNTLTPPTTRRHPRGGRCALSTPSPSPIKRTPGSCTKTPTAGDRFIPTRDDDLDIANYYLSSHFSSSSFSYSSSSTTTTPICRPPSSPYVSALEESCFDGRTQSKILTFKAKAPQPHIHVQQLHAIYPTGQHKGTSPKKPHRHISQKASRVLDAPDLADDFYLNIVDWSCDNILAVALGNTVYFWNATTAEISQLPANADEDPITSVAWIHGGTYLAVGTERNTVQLWDVAKQKRVREMRGHSGRVGVLAWSGPILSSGSRDNNVFNHDVRISDHHIATFSHHSGEVCGLKWNFGGTLLASGGNDNIVNIWDVRSARHQSPLSLSSPSSSPSPLYTLPHSGAVKALAWCPFQHNLLATGGGTSDRSIRFWSSSTGALLNSIDTKSQVCQLLWSTHYKELVSAHGFSQNQLAVWKYPSMSKIMELEGHTSRVLYLALSPDGETCVSAAGDETLRFWKVFEKENSKSGSSSFSKIPSSSSSSLLGSNTLIR